MYHARPTRPSVLSLPETGDPERGPLEAHAVCPHHHSHVCPHGLRRCCRSRVQRAVCTRTPPGGTYERATSTYCYGRHCLPRVGGTLYIIVFGTLYIVEHCYDTWFTSQFNSNCYPNSKQDDRVCRSGHSN